jgi:hypothetical protein
VGDFLPERRVELYLVPGIRISTWYKIIWIWKNVSTGTAITKSSVGDPCHFGADPDLTLDPTPASDPTPFLSNFKDEKTKIFFIFLPAGTLSSFLKI